MTRTFEAVCFGASIALGGVLVLMACTARETAKDAYYVQSHACLVAFTTKADQTECLAKVRGNWSEAGAPPAAALDGGAE